MTFRAWMMKTYPNDSTVCGDLAAYLNRNNPTVSENCYDDLLPYLDGLNAPWDARHVFDLCWRRYHEDQYWFDDFIGDCCEIGDGFIEKSGRLQDAYRAYSNYPGKCTHSTKDFYGKLKAMGFSRNRTNKGSFVRGLRLKDA